GDAEVGEVAGDDVWGAGGVVGDVHHLHTGLPRLGQCTRRVRYGMVAAVHHTVEIEERDVEAHLERFRAPQQRAAISHRYGRPLSAALRAAPGSWTLRTPRLCRLPVPKGPPAPRTPRPPPPAPARGGWPPAHRPPVRDRPRAGQ